MQAHRRTHGNTPPPLPMMPGRTVSSSTVSTVRTAHTQYSGLLPPASPLGAPFGAALSPTSSGPGPTDDLDKLGYQYSLRVAVLHNLLESPAAPVSAIGKRSSTSSSFSHHPTSPAPPLPSPPLTGTSPNGSRFTSFSFGHSPSSTPPPVPPSTPPPPAVKRKTSAWNLGKKEKSEEGSKLPKEFLIEFWGTMGAEDGDDRWKEAVSIFLKMVKKGTKTPSGLNLREIPTLLEAFSSTIPSATPGQTAVHVHQSHLLQLLYNTLPRSSHFSPISRPQTEKDKDLLFRLRAEVQSYMLTPSPNPQVDTSTVLPSPLTPVSTTAKRSPIGLGKASTQSDSASVRRKPSPVWDGDSIEMVNTVCQVWGVRRDITDRDMLELKSSGKSLEQMYMSDLKRAMTLISACPPPLTQSQKTRQSQLSQSISNLMSSFPDLTAPSNPADYCSPFNARESMFFTPPRSIEVFGRLTTRSAEVGHNPKTRDLVEKCREIWGISSRREKEKELEGLLPRWEASIGTSDEVPLAKVISDGLKIISAGLRPGDPLPGVMSEILSNLLSIATSSLPTIFPATSLPPPPPPKSLLLLWNACPSLFADQETSRKSIEGASDEMKGSAIGEYVQAVETFLGGVGMGAEGDEGRVIEGLEKVAGWMEKEISNVKRVWGKGLEGIINPASVILLRQLPLFLAELQSLPPPTTAHSNPAGIFTLYETTGKLLHLWDDLCASDDGAQDLGFDLDRFYEPYVRAWLSETEGREVGRWVERSVGMDSWVPEGENKHSQSVIDLFDFIRGSAQIILHELPLGEYKRAIYLVDYSRTVSCAVSQYASTLAALFSAEINPPVATPLAALDRQVKFGGKAGNWLAKGQQAMRGLEKKAVVGFSVPPAACVKLTDIGATKTSLEDLSFALEAESTSSLLASHLANRPSRATNHTFNVTVLRGEGLLTRGLAKAADAFVIIADKENGERLIKTKTVLGTEDPKWEESLQVSVGAVKILELQVYDRQLVGKHDLLATSSFKLDPRLFISSATRDVVLPLSPRGTVHIRINMASGTDDTNNIQYHLDAATRTCERTERDMRRELIDKMGEFMKDQLSVTTLQTLTKPLKDKKKAKVVLTEQDLEDSLGLLFEYLNESFSVFSVTLTFDTRIGLMLSIWRRIIDILISLLVPPLSDKPSTAPPLPSQEIDVIFKWLQMLKAFFNASEGGVEHGVPLSQLTTGPYKDIVMLGQYMDLPTQSLKERCSAAVRAAGKGGGAGGGMTGLSLENGGDDGERMAEVLLRIARTRPDTHDFLVHEINQLIKSRVEKQGGLL